MNESYNLLLITFDVVILIAGSVVLTSVNFKLMFMRKRRRRAYIEALTTGMTFGIVFQAFIHLTRFLLK